MPEETAVSAACDAQRLRLLGPGDRWERARIFCSARTVRAFTCQASRGAHAWAPRRRAVLDASGGGDRIFHQDIVVRGSGHDDEGRGRERREPGLGTPRGAMRPVPVPVLLPCPCRGLKDQRGPWAPSCDRHGMDHPPPWPLASGGGDPRPLFCKIPGTRPCMVLLHAGRSAGHCRPLQAAIGGAGGSLLTQGASSCEDNRVAFFQGRTALPGARRKAPSRQRAPQGHGRARGLMGLDERRPQLPHTDPLARSMRGPSIRTNDGLAMHGSTTRGLPTRVRSWGRAGVPLVTRRGQQALDRDCPHLQALGCAPWGSPGRYFLRVLPLLLTMEGAVHAQLFHGWSKVFPLKRQSDDLTVGVKHGDACRYRYQNVHREVEEVEQFFVSSHMKNAIGAQCRIQYSYDTN